MKVYVIIAQVVYDACEEQMLTRVFAEESNARYCLNSLKKELRSSFVEEQEWTSEESDTSFTTYLEGEYSAYHAYAYMVENEVE